MRNFKEKITCHPSIVLLYYVTRVIRIDYSNIDIPLKFRPFIIEYYGVDGVPTRHEGN